MIVVPSKRMDVPVKQLWSSDFQIHLKDEDFKRIFGMAYTEFSKIPAWKQKEMKKNNKLF